MLRNLVLVAIMIAVAAGRGVAPPVDAPETTSSRVASQRGNSNMQQMS